MRRTLYVLAAVVAGTAPLAAQEDRQMPDSARRARLEEAIEQRVEARLRQDLALTDEQVAKMRTTHQKFAPQMRETMQRQRELRLALGRQMQPGIAADPDSVRKLNDAIAENRARIFDLEQQREREMGAYLSPVQVARYRMMREHLRQRIDDVRRNWGRDQPGPGGRPRIQRGRPRARPR